MILYVNGDSHTAAAEAVNPSAFAEDDPQYSYLKRKPHPHNLNVSWGKLLSETLACKFVCDAESASSNERIIRTTRKWLDGPIGNNKEHKLVIIQWSTWEREEWLIDQEYYQVNASGVDVVPDSHRDSYKEFVANVDWKQKTQEAHEKIWDFHLYLQSLGIRHLFFNGNNSFSNIQDHRDWQNCYIDPYNDNSTYDAVLRNNGCRPVTQQSYHYGADGHRQWHNFVLKYIQNHKLMDNL